MPHSLCLSLGHNSSAVLVIDGNIVCGYENERLTGIKSDSQFPYHAIKEIGGYYDLSLVEKVYVSHWATFGDVDEMSYKHWKSDELFLLCPNAQIISNVDHHDCHVQILRVFTDDSFKWEIIADGFGNHNETISIYKDKELIHRVFGFEKSLGLLYQYTTAYLGLKMNQDEYKLLGYESHITEVLTPGNVNKLHGIAQSYAKKYLKDILDPQLKPQFDLVAGLDALPNIRLGIRNYLNNVMLMKLGSRKSQLTDYELKVIVAYFVQSTIEMVMSGIIDHFNITEVALSGGIFMNVKLNNTIAKKVERISILPICGDQSCGLGAYQHYNKDLVWPDHLFWGRRDLSLIPLNISKLKVCKSFGEAADNIVNALYEDKIVNIVYGNMEFGARALGHTTTLALPSAKNVDYINVLNDRSSIMPMAGMISESILGQYHNPEKVHKSLEYMVMTLDLIGTPFERIMGCHHKHPTKKVWTNRVQVVKNQLHAHLLEIFKMLINTSFNVHGQPIVCTMDQIVFAHKFQIERDVEDRVITIIIK